MTWILLTASFFQICSTSVVRAAWFSEYPTMMIANGSEVIPSDYDKNAFPSPPGGGPMKVYVKFALENLLDINEDKGIYLSFYWPDSRLIADKLTGSNFTSLSLSPSMENDIWVPDLMIYDLQEMERVMLLRRLGALVVFKNGYIKVGLYLRTTVSCDMDFSDYPFDTQTCYVEFGSYSYFKSQMTFDWMPESMNIYSNDKLTRNNFHVELTRGKPGNNCYGGGAANCYSTVLVTLKLRRRTAFFLWHTFLPCVLLVMTSWLSMLLPPEVIPGRMVLCITSLLALLTMFTSSLTGLEVSYIRASDIWYVGCLIFDFLIILEYVVLIFVQRTLREMSETEVTAWVRPRSVHPTAEKSPGPTSLPRRVCLLLLRGLQNPSHMDRVCRWILVILFFAFNIGYWAWFSWCRHVYISD